MKRRNFIKASSSLMLLPLLPAAHQALAAGVDMNDPAVKALGYVEIASDADRTEKMGVAGPDQICGNCRFYSASDANWGGCALFRNELVRNEGWCKGWVPTA